jgi:hypothetical protein
MAKLHALLFHHKQLLILLLLLLFGVAIYLPWTDKSLAADDFKVVYDVSTGKIFNFNGFFRPIADLSFWLNVKVWGVGAKSFFVTNLLIHLLNVLLVFLLGQRMLSFFEVKNQWFPTLAALFFLCYPFHNEPLFWAVGRGASMAAFFALSILYIAMGNQSIKFRAVSISVLYLLGLMAYETILPLFILLLILAYFKKERRLIGVSTIISLGVLIVYFLLRNYFSGAVFQGYSEGIIHLKPSLWVEHIFKMLARQWFPPLQNSTTFLSLSFGVALVIGVVGWWLLKKIRSEGNGAIKMTWFLLITWLIFMVVASSFPISTKTSETDRLLYLPSIPLSIIAAWVVTLLPVSFRIQMAITAVITVIGIAGIVDNARNWETASIQTRNILKTLETSSCKGGKTFVLNLPQEYKGAFVFRNGFYQALLLQGSDTTGIQMGKDYEVHGTVFQVILPQNNLKITLNPSVDCCFFWDGVQLNRLFPEASSMP